MNCLTYAFSRWISDGGYICCRKSQLCRMFPRPRWHPVHLVPHFLHRTYEGEVSQYVPTEEQKRIHIEMGLFRSWLSLWRFDGHVIGDDL